MSLRDIRYKPDYRSGYDNLVDDLFRPSLRESKSYWRAVGYFSSSSLESFGTPLGQFVKNDGQIRLVTSVELSAADLHAIERGASRQDVCSQRIEQVIDAEFSDGLGDGTARLARLLELDRLQIKIAVPKTRTGLYHEKIGIFFGDHDFVAFTGSSNESRNALENNRECVDVYSSWDDPVRAHRKRAHFEALWNQTDPGVLVFSFPEAARRRLLRASRRNSRSKPPSPIQSDKWRHQDEALQIFLRSERGVLDMATGTGKTRTALNILQVLFDRDQIDTVIVCTDGNDLLDQWYRALLSVRDAISASPKILRHYAGLRELDAFALSPTKSILLISRQPVARALDHLSVAAASRTLLIHDEVHGLGSPGNRERLAGLSDSVRFRLGLSATPERSYDQEGTDFITEHIGPVLMQFGLEEAISRGILTPFHYFPIPFKLTELDKQRIAAVYRKRKARESTPTPMTDTELWIEIARVHKTSEAKLPLFAEFMKSHQGLLTRCIVFTETMEYGNSVLDIVHEYRPDFHTYYAGADKSILLQFARGDLECLVTCHRLSEGIDIKSVRTVMLFSSERGRLETIQRIGRSLRINPGDPDKVANVVDFVRESESGAEPTADEQRRDWLMGLAGVRPK